jgi:hypothetical protein
MPSDRDLYENTVGRYRAYFVDGLSEGHKFQLRRLKGDHYTGMILANGAHRARSVTDSDLAIHRGRRATLNELPDD